MVLEKDIIILGYADDVSVIARCKKELKEVMVRFDEETHTMELLLNENK